MKKLIAALMLSTGLVGPALAGQSATQCVSSALAGGTPDAITIPMLPCGTATSVLILTLSGANTVVDPTLQMAGYPELPIQTSTGDDLAVAELPAAGAIVMLTGTGSAWRIVSGNATEGFVGTLTVPNGGTGATSFTGNGIVYGNGTSALGVTAAGTDDQVLVGNTSSVPTWADISSLGIVSSLSFGSTGLTPSSPTTGDVVVAGTLAVANGGTGQSSYTNGQLLIGNTTGNTLTKATLTAGSNVSITNGTGSITISSTGLASGCSPTPAGAGWLVTSDGATGCVGNEEAQYTTGGGLVITTGGASITGNTSVLSGSFTASGGAFAASPANANVVMSPTGTGLVTIAPATAGTLNNMAIGGTTAQSGAFTTVAASSTSTFANTATFSGTSGTLAVKLPNAAEPATISATAATGTIAYDVCTQSVLYYTSNAAANWTVNLRCSSGTSLNTAMATGDVVTVTFLVTQGGTAYYNSALQVDGGAVTPKYQGGTAWSAGNINGIDAYTYAIVKTGSAAFTVLASQTQFK